MKSIILVLLSLVSYLSYSQDTTIFVDDNRGEWLPFKASDNGDGTYSFSVEVVNPSSSTVSNDVTVTQYSNSNLSTLISNVNTYLSGSSDKLVGITFFAWGTVTPTFYALIIESE